MRMAEQFLHRTEIGPFVEQMSRKRMPKHMRADVLRQRSSFDNPIQNMAHSPRRERIASGVDK